MSPMPKKAHLEADTKAEVKKLLDEHDYFWWMPPANGFGQSGISDFHAVKAGVFLAIETKRGTAKPKPTPLQVAFLNSIRAADHFAFVVNDARLPHLKAFLGALDRSAAAAAKRQMPTPEDGAMLLNAIKELTTEL